MIHTHTHVHTYIHPYIHEYRYIHVRNYIRMYKVYENAVRAYAFKEPIGDSRVFRDWFFLSSLTVLFRRTFLYFIPRVALGISVSRFAFGGWQNSERERGPNCRKFGTYCTRISVNKIDDITVSLLWMSFQNFLFQIKLLVESNEFSICFSVSFILISLFVIVRQAMLTEI